MNTTQAEQGKNILKKADKSQEVFNYHERSKHFPYRYAKSSGYLDWSNEPFPFRIYDGARTIKLSLEGKDSEAEHLGLYKRGNNKLKPFTLEHISKFLELSMGLSAWKGYGENSWALRMNPSSGNLHPTEAHLILPPLPENNNISGIYHYNPLLHVLEVRADLGDDLWRDTVDHFQREGFLVALSSIYWREAWKYGERAFRYCNHDVGHALACLSFSANLLGWKVTALSSLSDEEIKKVLGFQKIDWKMFEKESPDILLFIHKSDEEMTSKDLSAEIISSFEKLSFHGKPNQLSRDHVDWEIIEKVSATTIKPASESQCFKYHIHDYIKDNFPSLTATRIIRQRRSAQAYDGKTSLPKEHFYAMLDKTIPRSEKAPFDLKLGEINVHLLIFVHRIEGLPPGLYFLFRNNDEEGDFRAACHARFRWEKPKDTPDHLGLYLLEERNFEADATMISCNQSIAGDGAFSLGMIAKFRENIEKDPSSYRRLFWETGMIGQVLYLEAEAHSVRGTGIGCFFDDMVHELLGLPDNRYQSLYHFTVGGPIEDKRIKTLPPYHHLKDPG